MADQPPNEKGSDRIDDRTPSMDQPPKIVQAPAPTIKVLLRVYPDGYCEIFADGQIHAYIQKILQAPGVAGERLAIEYADATIPLSHKNLDDARKLVQTFDTRPVSVSQFVTMRESLAALRIIDAYQRRVSA